MTTVAAALAAMAEAEERIAFDSSGYAKFVHDTIERNRATLQRHFQGIGSQYCVVCRYVWPCPDAAAVINAWTGSG